MESRKRREMVGTCHAGELYSRGIEGVPVNVRISCVTRNSEASKASQSFDLRQAMNAATANHTSAEKRLSARLKMAYKLTERSAFWSACAFAGVSCQRGQSAWSQTVCSCAKYTGRLAMKNASRKTVRTAPA